MFLFKVRTACIPGYRLERTLTFFSSKAITVQERTQAVWSKQKRLNTEFETLPRRRPDRFQTTSTFFGITTHKIWREKKTSRQCHANFSTTLVSFGRRANPVSCRINLACIPLLKIPDRMPYIGIGDPVRKCLNLSFSKYDI